MKRSNRLILLIGVFLAVIAFVAVVLFLGQGGPNQPGASTAPTELPTVFAKADIPLGTPITQAVVDSSLELRTIPVTQRDPTAFNDPSLLIGSTLRADVKAGQQLTSAQFGSGGALQANFKVPPGLRAMAVQVDQISGVGTVIQPGDYVDMVVAITGDHFPVITIDPNTNTITPVAGLNQTSVKVLIQGMQVLGTLLPPPPAQTQATPAPSAGTGGGPSTALTGQQQIVIVGVTAQQAEIIKFSQLDGSITLVLRSPDDFVDENGQKLIPPPEKTSGITLKILTDLGVIPPELVETVLPTRR